MRKMTRLGVVAAGTLLTIGLAGPAMAAPGDSGNGFGGCVDNFYGNATNPRDGGHGVLPSESPGPWTMAGNFLSMGDVQHYLAGVGVRGQDAQQLICTFP